jgi:hypothetical protein
MRQEHPAFFNLGMSLQSKLKSRNCGLKTRKQAALRHEVPFLPEACEFGGNVSFVVGCVPEPACGPHPWERAQIEALMSPHWSPLDTLLLDNRYGSILLRVVTVTNDDHSFR